MTHTKVDMATANQTNAAPSTVSVKVHIMGKEYQIQCPPKEKHQLIQAAVDVDTRMRSAKNNGPNISVEKAAVLTALNLANELQGATDNTDMLESVSDSIIDMKARIDRALIDKPNNKLASDQASQMDSGDSKSQVVESFSQAQLL